MAKAAIRWMMTRPGQPIALAEFDPFPPGPGEVVVEIAGCGVCHTDLGYYYDGVRTKHELPLALGHEHRHRCSLVHRPRGYYSCGDPVRPLRCLPARQGDDLPEPEDAGQRYSRRLCHAHRGAVARAVCGR